MQMTFRWYGDGNDDITPEMIRQIPGVGGLVWALHDKQPGEIWTVEEIEKVRARIEAIVTARLSYLTVSYTFLLCR